MSRVIETRAVIGFYLHLVNTDFDVLKKTAIFLQTDYRSWH
jgi:hypothetical protein